MRRRGKVVPIDVIAGTVGTTGVVHIFNKEHLDMTEEDGSILLRYKG